MADAYARLRGRPTFVYGAYGPGAANVAGSLAEPFWSGSPVVALASAMRRTERFRKEYQELDQPPLFASVTKWGVEASVPTHVPRLVREAARHAISGAPGPVYLGIPNDLFEAEMPGLPRAGDRSTPPMETAARAPGTDRRRRRGRGPRARPAPSGRSSWPATASTSRARTTALRQVAERLGIPVATSSSGKGSIAETHELALGSVGRYSRKYANAALRDADVVLAIGTPLGGLVTDSYRLIGQDTRLIHVNVDPEVIGLNFPTELGLVADARTFLEAVLDGERPDRRPAVASGDRSPTSRTWPQERAAWRERRAGLAAQDGSRRQPDASRGHHGQRSRRRSPSDAVLVADTGYSAAWAGALAEVKRGRPPLPARGRVTRLGIPGRARCAAGGARPAGRLHHR